MHQSCIHLSRAGSWFLTTPKPCLQCCFWRVQAAGFACWHVAHMQAVLPRFIWGRPQGLALSTFQVVLVPTLVGVGANELAPGLVRRIKPILPLLGVALTTLLCASPVAQVAELLRWADGCHPERVCAWLASHCLRSPCRHLLVIWCFVPLDRLL